MLEIEQIENAVEQLKKEVWYLAKVTIPSLSGGGSTTELNNIKQQIETITTTITGLNSHLSSIDGITEELRARDDNVISSINTIENDINQQLIDIRKQISELASNAPSGGETVDIIYDMKSEDPDINRGFTTGMVGGTQFSADLTGYKKLIFYGALNKNDATAVSFLDIRQFLDVTLHNASVGLNKFWFLKISVPLARNKVIIGQAGYYEFNAIDKVMEFTREKGNELYYLYRVEGIK